MRCTTAGYFAFNQGEAEFVWLQFGQRDFDRSIVPCSRMLHVVPDLKIFRYNYADLL